MKPTSKAVQKIAHFFNLPISTFFLYPDDEPYEYNPFPMDKETFNLFKSLSPKKQKEIISYINYLSERDDK